MTKIYPRTEDKQMVYLNAVVKDSQIEIGDYTVYNDFVSDPLLFEKIMCFTITLFIGSGW